VITRVVRRLAALLAAAVLAATVACSGGRAVATSAIGNVDHLLRALPVIDDVVRIPRVPWGVVAREEVAVLAPAAREEAITLVAPHVDDLTVIEAQQVVVGACLANDILELGHAHTWADAATQAVTVFGGRPKLTDRVAALGADMALARTAVDKAVQIGAVLVCEVV
jgi:hypothetical protein